MEIAYDREIIRVLRLLCCALNICLKMFLNVKVKKVSKEYPNYHAMGLLPEIIIPRIAVRESIYDKLKQVIIS